MHCSDPNAIEYEPRPNHKPKEQQKTTHRTYRLFSNMHKSMYVGITNLV